MTCTLATPGTTSQIGNFIQEEEGRPEEVTNNKLELEGEIEVIFDAL